ncbi:hypothetical protein F8M41_010957 [Gigaspora margarita]|uniref:Uncharacterized protein n=1 Tax=Gigaspora margarita TaxID=4874 RepID=A0A8H3X0S3_GIGMA|nr:hypothetical protein F8M41_010957 [Gigaspora margarita]
MASMFEIGFLVFCIGFTSMSSGFMLYQCVSNFTKLRLACLISLIAILTISVCNFIRDLNAPLMGLVTYWFIFALVRATYTTILVVCMLDMGRKFYGEKRWNTMLFKSTIFQLFIFDSVNIVDATLIYVERLDRPEFPLFLSQLILGVSTITSSFLYAFLPVLTVHISKSATQKCHINAQSAAVGTWYMTITGILSIMYLTLYLVIFCVSDELNYSPIGNALDCLLRTGISLAIGLPPPIKVIHVVKMKIVGRMSTHVAPRDQKRILVNEQEFEQIC